MSLPQALVFWLMVAAMYSTFVDIEKARGEIKCDTVQLDFADGLIPVNRKIMDAIAAGRL